ncbi:TPA: hypothetical protein DD449_01965 [Candidatus Berkelbacteria bacterium]|uniref:Rod shape-determining protein MreD n=1 Tax=Berkelbacteria bacterium GW2011_GWE1_39_12 TaxID=1618337 RepID=A0A0G4B4E7_9BACT|nr:MAG: rod shape-determining protein MreD [Berkelbacteria bacterium GW2011_GWE1_39_12]HBO60424.1 hypothetical protein [Candidatus Berkelbacteria bacterium]
MNKILKIIIFILIGILQLTLMPLLQIKGMIPDLVLIGCVVFAIVDLQDDALLLAIAGGLILDWAGPLFFGFHTIVFVGFVLIIRFLLQKILPDMNSILIFIITFFFALVYSCFQNLLYNRWPSLNLFSYGLYSAVLSIVFFFLLQRLHNNRNLAVKL